MTATAREDFFTLIHKGQRRQLFAFTTSAGTIPRPRSASGFLGSAERMPKIHGKHEDKHFFPLIAGRVPRVTASMNARHGEMDEALEKVTGMIEAAVAAPAQSARLAAYPGTVRERAVPLYGLAAPNRRASQRQYRTGSRPLLDGQ